MKSFRLYPNRRNDTVRVWVLDRGVGSKKRYFKGELRIAGYWKLTYDYSAPEGEPWAWLESDSSSVRDNVVRGG